MRTLTKKQRQVYDFIKRFIEENRYAPSYEEIAQGLGLSSVSTVHVHIENLAQKGYLRKKWNANRSIDIQEGHRPLASPVELPLEGRIAAGEPIEAIEDVETIAVPADLIGRNETYVLQVKGDSMVDDHVLDGDFVIVEKRPVPADGEMVVALIRGGEVTLKRFHRERNKIRLEPANPAYSPMIFDENEVRIQGVVIGILRKYMR
ncbi:MAG: transcriptional repressor LexA [Deltaproteobacteria bacterium]